MTDILSQIDIMQLVWLSLVTHYTAAKDENDRTPLHFACSGGHKELVKYFLQEYDIGEYLRM